MEKEFAAASSEKATGKAKAKATAKPAAKAAAKPAAKKAGKPAKWLKRPAAALKRPAATPAKVLPNGEPCLKHVFDQLKIDASQFV